MTCKNCIYWTEDDSNEYEYNRGNCNNKKFIYAEDLYDISTQVRKTPDEDTLVYGDYEGYSAYFTTGPEFSCIHFKKEGDENEVQIV